MSIPLARRFVVRGGRLDACDLCEPIVRDESCARHASIPDAMDAFSPSHDAPNTASIDDASLWSALFHRFLADQRVWPAASDDQGAHSDADEFTARALPVGLVPASVDGSRLTALRPPLGRRWA
jgi:hypothetical protein